ncbi:MAG: ABC transporter ATP-binding protein/permease [Microscillaceae bacterium]|nr:ABC transporter ATP-binding protein/permease [Microscillaceae bacterium]
MSGKQETITWKENLEAFKNIPKFFRLIWETSPSLTIANAILRLLQSLIPLSSLYVAKLIIDEIVFQIQTDKGNHLEYLWLLVAIEFGLVFFSDILSRGITLIDALLGDLFANESSIRLMKHAASLDLPQFEDAIFYDKLERARRQTLGRVMLMSQLLGQTQEIISLIFLAIGLISFNFWLILILIVAVIPSFLSEAYFNRSSYSLVRNWTPERRQLDYFRYIGASNETAKELKIFGLSDFLTERFRELSDRYYQLNKSLSVKRAVWGVVLSALGNVGYYTAYLYIVWQTIQGKLSLGDLTFLTGSFSRMQSILQGILTRFTAIAQNALYLQDWFDFFAMQPKIVSPTNAQAIPKPMQKGLTFENVGFKYPNSEVWAVRHISFHLNAGEKLALVGENGAGKTTLVKLISRLYDPDEGRILLDGVDLKDYQLNEYLRSVGVIFQDYIRYQLSASDNIAVGQITKRTDNQLITQSATQSLANTVIEKLPKGYEQMLGKTFTEGMDLSGGEWQKIALGRAYMREAQILILDEPTAALDARAEYEVFVRFSELTQGKTAVLISHRFSTVRMADRILVLKKGEMVELGSHEELLAKNGLYAELFNLQAEGYR